MASTVKAELSRANPNQIANMANLSQLGDGLGIVPRTELVTVAANVGVLSQPAASLVAVFATAGGATGELDLIKRNGAVIAGDCAINAVGNVVFAAADAVTEAEITYIPIEGEEFTETIPVTLGGVGTLLQTRRAIQLTAATLVAPAATPGAKTLVARGTLVGALGAGEAALQAGGTTIAFVAAEAAAACTATVTYLAFPGEGEGTEDPFGDRLDAEVDLT